MGHEKPTEKCRFASRFGGGWLSDNQWLAESMVDRQARRARLRLPPKFWDTPRWKREFLAQVRHANALLRLYDVEAVVRALRTPEGKRAYSLGAPFLDPLIKHEQERLTREREAAKSAPVSPPPTSPAQAPRPAFVNAPSVLSKLKGL